MNAIAQLTPGINVLPELAKVAIITGGIICLAFLAAYALYQIFVATHYPEDIKKQGEPPNPPPPPPKPHAGWPNPPPPPPKPHAGWPLTTEKGVLDGIGEENRERFRMSDIASAAMREVTAQDGKETYGPSIPVSFANPTPPEDNIEDLAERLYEAMAKSMLGQGQHVTAWLEINGLRGFHKVKEAWWAVAMEARRWEREKALYDRMEEGKRTMERATETLREEGGTNE